MTRVENHCPGDLAYGVPDEDSDIATLTANGTSSWPV